MQPRRNESWLGLGLGLALGSDVNIFLSFGRAAAGERVCRIFSLVTLTNMFSQVSKVTAHAQKPRL